MNAPTERYVFPEDMATIEFHHTAGQNDDNISHYADSGSKENNISVISVDKAIERLGTGNFQRKILIAAGLCFAADAMEIMLLSFLSLVLDGEWGLTGVQTATITSCVFAGAMIGTLILGPLGDRIGRRPVFLLAGTIITTFGILTSFVNTFVGMVIVRFFVGFGVGGLTVPFDILAEFLPTETRGKYLLLLEYFWTVGAILVTVIAYYTIGAGLSWRVFVFICALPCFFSVVLGLFLVPESPRWLILHNKEEEARAILKSAARINGYDPDTIFPDSQRLHEEREEHASLSEVFSPKWRKLTILLWGVWFGFANGYYGTVIVVTNVFESSNQHDEDGHNFDYGAILVSCFAEAVGLIIVVYGIDQVGRIWAQVLSYGVGGITLFLFCTLAESGSKTMLVILAFVTRAFEMSGNCVTWVATAEILPTEIRTTGHSAANAVARIGAFVCPYLIHGISLPTVGIVLLAIHVCTCFCAYNLPETKGRKLGEASVEDGEDNSYEIM